MVVEIVKRKKSKDSRKPQNRQWELSELSLRCILEFWNEGKFLVRIYKN